MAGVLVVLDGPGDLDQVHAHGVLKLDARGHLPRFLRADPACLAFVREMIEPLAFLAEGGAMCQVAHHYKDDCGDGHHDGKCRESKSLDCRLTKQDCFSLV